MREYTVWSAVAVLVVVALEVLWLGTGLFRTSQYWIAMAIVFGFQCLVDGWLTKLSAPVVLYGHCLLYTSPSPRDRTRSRMPSSA